ncbi:Transketolase, pyrimidine binding domain-containing protein [Lentinula detonsa]|uniref:Transketolase, pyrimidine binding domain-containing protein n=1 Tax=Lentinula detonsa TaxID=2804962 RepID=A0AA38UUK8_9AGAR|nr:Transketolase, pyrimidine binding domain-containing protein [Lentinula detonsa]
MLRRDLLRKSFILPLRRSYHDESFGFRKPPSFVFPDYNDAQLENRHHNAALLRYVDSVRTHGHRAARIDPLDLIPRDSEVAALNPSRYGLKEGNKRYNVNGIIWTNSKVEAQRNDTEEWWTLDDITRHLREVYVGKIAYEYMHSQSKTERLWFSHLLESNTMPQPVDKQLKQRIHGLLARSEVFDNFLQLKFPNLKRVPARGSVSHIIVGMPHRGRLNFLTDPQLLQYPPTALFHKIRGGAEHPADLGVEGDVISHLVSSVQLEYDGAREPLKASLLPNPSHLEAVNAVALGKTRAKQYSLLKTHPDDCQLGDKVMCVQLHGDASFSGQGVVMESLGLSNLPHFTSGGTVHLVVDIGYTTPASQARSSLYCSDIGKMINAPVLHVNGDHPEDVVKAMDIAFKYRQYFRKDIIVDLLVYRRCLTSPLMYEKISARRSVPQMYEEKLIADETLTPEDINSVRTQYRSQLDAALAQVPSYTPRKPSMLEAQWAGMVWPGSTGAIINPDTGVERDLLERVGRASVRVPEGFEIHPKLQRHVKNRLASLDSGKGVDWASAEALAFGTLLLEGNDVRISGQDVGRGTFSQRHAMLVDQRDERTVVPLNDMLDGEGKIELANSSLSEMAVLGFEYGASWERPTSLPIWEAQFGDFFNGAQIIIDTFVSSSETKWLKQSGIVMLLPHGLDGAGPEHSSSRLERFLQLTNDRYDGVDPVNINMHVVFPTTPAQYFHLLRRQMKRNYRKPLVVAGPKGLLRLSAAASSLSDFESGTSFKPVLPDPVGNESTAKRVIVLSGKIYYDLIKERKERGLDDVVSFVRLEELAPFPFQELQSVLKVYPQEALKEVFYLQEEPRNQGPWTHVRDRLDWVLQELGSDARVSSQGRKESALPAPGVGNLYKEQQQKVIDSAFEGL